MFALSFSSSVDNHPKTVNKHPKKTEPLTKVITHLWPVCLEPRQSLFFGN
jgi:hypothetical protein